MRSKVKIPKKNLFLGNFANFWPFLVFDGVWRYLAVIFDMGGVILPSPNPAISKFEKKNGIPRGTGKFGEVEILSMILTIRA